MFPLGVTRVKEPSTVGDNGLAAPENPLLDHLGIRLASWEVGRASFTLSVEPRHLNLQRRLQGGLVATLLDAACGYAGLRVEPGRPAVSGLTLMLNIAYSAGVSAGAVTATGRVIGGGRRIYFATGEVLAEDGTLIASAQGTFRRSASPD